MSDLIDRQVAIDALCDEYCGGWQDCKHYPKCENLKAIQNLPSAQPEIIRCKDCKHFEYDHVENVNGIPLIVAHEICTRWEDGVKTSENGYCFLAERRQHE